jgi:hypothetical protein
MPCTAPEVSSGGAHLPPGGDPTVKPTVMAGPERRPSGQEPADECPAEPGALPPAPAATGVIALCKRHRCHDGLPWQGIADYSDGREQTCELDVTRPPSVFVADWVMARVTARGVTGRDAPARRAIVRQYHS